MKLIAKFSADGTYPFSQLHPLMQLDPWVMKKYRFSRLLDEHVSAAPDPRDAKR